MAKKPETILKEKVLDDLKTIPGVYTVKIQQVVIRGTPDLFICVNGLFIAVELKSPGEKPDERQVYELNKIKAAGGLVFTVYPDTWHAVLDFIKDIAKKGQ